MEPRQLSITQAGAALARGELSVVELVRSVLERIQALNDTMRAFICVRPEEVLLAEARRLDALARDEAETMPLRGIPVALKANYGCAGVPTSAGSLILRDWIPSEDAETVALLRNAGAVVVGMTNMNEFANGPTGYNPHYGNALNPWDPSRMPGGSSSGSAVALALDMCLGATGSDTGGSIRTPSAFCGTVGLKPTVGLLSTRGIFPFSRTLDHAGPLGRTVDDVEVLFKVMCGRSATPPTEATSLTGLVVGVDRQYFTRVLQPAVRTSFERALEQFEELGAAVRTADLTEVEGSLPAELAILFPEAALVHERWLDQRPGDYVDEVRDSILSGRRYSALEYLRAQEKRAAIQTELDRAFEQMDVLATPTTIMQAPAWEEERFQIDGREIDPLNAFIRCTAPFNLSGHPAISLPCGVTPGGLPVGIQLVAPRGKDDSLLQIARCLEAQAT